MSDEWFSYQILPRVLRLASACNTESSILGHRIALPLCVAPTAYLCLAHPDGELAVARGLLRRDIIITVQ